MRAEHSPHPCQCSPLSVFLITAILVGVRLNLIVVLICICLMTNDVAPLFLCLQPSVCLLQRTVCLARLPVSELVYCLFFFFILLVSCLCFSLLLLFWLFCFLRQTRDAVGSHDKNARLFLNTRSSYLNFLSPGVPDHASIFLDREYCLKHKSF